MIILTLGVVFLSLNVITVSYQNIQMLNRAKLIKCGLSDYTCHSFSNTMQPISKSVKGGCVMRPITRLRTLESLQRAIDETVADIEAAEEMIEAETSEAVKMQLRERNEIRKQELYSLRDAILDDVEIRRDIY